MPCLCTRKSLRLFIRSVAQVDLSTSIIRRSPKQFQKTPTRNFTSSCALREQYRRTDFAPSPVSKLSNDIAPATKPSLNTQQVQSISKRRPGRCVRDRTPPEINLYDNADTAFVDLSAESVDAIAADFKNVFGALGGQPATEIRFERGVRAADSVSRTTFRRTNVQNTELTIHFSAPRAPLNRTTTASRDPQPNIKSKTGFLDATKPAKSFAEEEWTPPRREHWQMDKAALKEKFPDGWKPRKKLSPDALAGIRALHAQMPEQYTTSALAVSFQVSPESIRRILKSKWTPDSDEEIDRNRRWFNRGKQIYAKHAELGLKPPRKWRDIGIGRGKPAWKNPTPLPALITTARRQDEKYGLAGDFDSDGLADRIL